MFSLATRHFRTRIRSRTRSGALTRLLFGPHRPWISQNTLLPTPLVSKTVISSKTNTPNCTPVDPSLLIEESYLVEEETLHGYRPAHYYPVYVGQVFRERYSVIGKLGYGTASTVWLCHDLQQDNAYVALKVYTNNPARPQRELPVYRHINSSNSQHGGTLYIRASLDSFEVTGPDGKHTCLVLEALGMNMEELRDLVPNREFEADLVRQSLREILRALHFLRYEAHVVHTDIQPKNILLGILDSSAFTRFENDERSDPFPRKLTPSRTIYTSRPMRLTKGIPRLSDFSEARFHSSTNTDLVMPNVYRAPEVILDIPWSYEIDLWGFAMTVWHLHPSPLFSPKGKDGKYSEPHHLAQMVAIMGPPPLDFLQQSKKSKKFWDEAGNWIGEASIPDMSLEVAEKRLEGEEKELFLTFMRKMLRWRPENRKGVEDVFMDEWLLADLIESGEVVR